MADMDISPAGLAALAAREGVRTKAYRDTRGIWTIGVGHTAAAGEPHPHEGMTLTQQQVMELFRNDLKQYVKAVNEAVKVTSTQNQFDAMVSLCFNIGPNGFAHSSVVRDLNAGQIHAAAEAFMLWDRPAVLRVVAALGVVKVPGRVGLQAGGVGVPILGDLAYTEKAIFG